MIRQSLKVTDFTRPAGWQAHLSSEEDLSGNPAKLNQPDDCRSDHREEAHGQSVIVAQKAKAFDPPNRVLYYDPLAGNRLVLGFLLLCQCSTPGFLVRGDELGMLLAVIAFVAHPGFVGNRLWQGGLFIELKVRLWPAMPSLQSQDFSVLVGGQLRLERVPFLLPRVEPLLLLWQRRPPHGRLKAVDNDLVYVLRRPGRVTLAPRLFCIPFLGGEAVTQERSHLVEGILRGVGTAPEEGADHLVLHVMAQVDQRHQHFVHRCDDTRTAVVGDQLAFTAGAALKPCRATALELWQDHPQQVGQEARG